MGKTVTKADENRRELTGAQLNAIAGAGWLRMPAQIGARGRGECPKMSHFHGPGAIAKQSGTMAGVL